MTRETLIVAIILFAGSPVRADDPVLVDTTTRLNLRTCPATVGCHVLRTLQPATRLEVLERQEEWFHVQVASDGDSGWVHSGYVAPAALPAKPFDGFALFERALHLLLRGKPAFFVVLTILVLAYLGAKVRLGEIPMRPLAGLIAASCAMGAILLLNQFGPLLSRFVASYVDLQPLSAIWRVNAVTAAVEYSSIIWFLLSLFLVGTVVSPAASGGRRAFLQGFATGFLLLPGIVSVIAVLSLVFWLLFQVLRFLGFVLGFILIPFIWIAEHLLASLLALLAWPFVWLWQNLLRDIVQFLGIPFVWLWKVVLSPLLAVLYKYLLRPLLLVALGVLATAVALFPVGIVGLALLESIRNAFKGHLNSLGLFSHGMSLGFLVFDAILLMALNAFGVMEATPPVTILLPVIVPVVGVGRLLLRHSALRAAGVEVDYRSKLIWYWKSSRAELFSVCLLMPVFAVLAVLFAEEE